MERFLIWYIHPEKDSFNGAILSTCLAELKQLGKKTMVWHVAALGLELSLSRGEYRASSTKYILM